MHAVVRPVAKVPGLIGGRYVLDHGRLEGIYVSLADAEIKHNLIGLLLECRIGYTGHFVIPYVRIAALHSSTRLEIERVYVVSATVKDEVPPCARERIPKVLPSVVIMETGAVKAEAFPAKA